MTVRHVEFNPAKLTDEARAEFWDKWEQDAETATRRVLEALREGDDVVLDQKIWSRLKAWLLENNFHGKCAYCEAFITATSYGDAEHWRPKGAVSTLPDDGVTLVGTGNDTHRGYAWLAYRWQNLLPACQKCNSEGKGTLFPIEGEYVRSPSDGEKLEDLDDREKPLLLHPYGEQWPEDHIEFDVMGYAFPRDGSRLGAMSIKVFGLSREILAEARRMHWKFMEALIDEAFREFRRRDIPVEETLRELLDEHAPFSCATRDYVNHKIDEFLEKLKRERDELEAERRRRRAGAAAGRGGG